MANSAFPAAIDSFTTKNNDVDTIDASHINDLQSSVVAIETALGPNAQGDFADVASRLASPTLVLGTPGDPHARGWLRFATENPDNDMFGIAKGGGTLNGVFDDVLAIGYNIDTGDGIHDPSKMQYAHTTEVSYNNGSYPVLEWNHSYTHAGGDYIVRPLEFAVDQNSANNANLQMAWRFRIGNIGTSFFRLTNPDRGDIFSILPDAELQLQYLPGHGLGITPQTVQARTEIRFGIATTLPNAYFKFDYPIGIGKIPATEPSNILDINGSVLLNGGMLYANSNSMLGASEDGTSASVIKVNHAAVNGQFQLDIGDMPDHADNAIRLIRRGASPDPTEFLRITASHGGGQITGTGDYDIDSVGVGVDPADIKIRMNRTGEGAFCIMPIRIRGNAGSKVVSINENSRGVDFIYNDDLVGARATFSHTGNIGFFSTSYAGGRGVFSLGNAIRMPSSNPASGGILYASKGAAHWRSASGTDTTFGADGPYCNNCGYDFWLAVYDNASWHASFRQCGWCGAEYRTGPDSVLDQLTDQQRAQII